MSLKETRSSSPDEMHSSEKVVINVGGIRHETYTATLKNIPDTRLFWITENKTQLPEYDPNANEYFFDRHPTVFGQILNFYRTGKLHCPNDVCGPLFEEELAFWGIDELQVESCCWLNYKKHREAQANLDTLDGNDSDRDSLSDMDMTVYGLVADSIRNRNRSFWKKYQPKVWTTFEEPYSSRLAQVIAFATLILILSSVVVFCLESMPYFKDKSSPQFQALYITDIICVAWFTLEFIIRLSFCPKKLQFFKKPMNWIDFGAIIPFYLDLFISESNIKTIVVLRVVRLIRVFRIFKLSRHSYGLQILGHTLKSSFSELFLLAFFLSIGVVIFSSIIYYAERDLPGTKFVTIPESFWWAVVTMTTLGYGDMTPKSWEGRIVGSLCAISGVLMIALPVPVIVSNFSLYYSHAKARLKLPKRKRPLIIGAANALKVAQSFVTQSSPKFAKQVVEQAEVHGQADSDMEEVRHSSDRMRLSPHSSFRSTPGSSPLGTRKLQSSNSASTPPFSRNSFMSSTRAVKSKGLSAVPEAERVEIELEERNPSCRIMMDNESSHTTWKNGEFQQSSSPKNKFLSKSTDQSTSMPSATSSVSASKSDSECAPTDVKAASVTTQKSNSSANSLSIESSQGSPKLNPRGRMGRRGSLYVVGFTAKHWQNKALKKNKRTQAGQTGATSRRASSTSPSERRGSTAFGLSATNVVKKDASNGTDFAVKSSPNKVSLVYSQLTAHEGQENLSKGKQTEPDIVLGALGDRHVSDERGANALFEMANGQIAGKTHFKPLSLNSGKLRDAYNKTTPRSVSTESNESSSRMSDDSLTINDRHRQRRGSSPLVRQRAVFTYDMSGNTVQVDPCVGGQYISTAKRQVSSGHAYEDNLFSLSPLLEQANEMGGDIEIRVPRRTLEMRRRSCIPAITTERKNSVKKSRGQSLLPNGYVNGSYHHDEDDRPINEKRSPNARHSGLSSVNGSMSGSVDSRLLSESHPVCMTVREQAYPTALLSSHGGPPHYTEAKSFGQYSGLPHIHVSSNSDSILPSINEENVLLNSKIRSEVTNGLRTPTVLPRPTSLPNWPREPVGPVVTRRPHSDFVYMNHAAYSFPSDIERMTRSSLGNIPQPVGFQNIVSPMVNQSHYQSQPVGSSTYGSFELQRRLSDADINVVGLAQRRQGPVLYIQVPETPIPNGDVSVADERDRIRESPRKQRARSRSYNCERSGSPFFQRTESISSPDLHSMGSTLTSKGLHSALSNSWHPSPEELHQKRTFADSKPRPFENTQVNVSSNTKEIPTRVLSVPKGAQNDIAVASPVDPMVSNLGRTRSSSWGGSSALTKGNAVGRGERAASPRLERTDRQVIYNGHEILQQRDSDRSVSVPVSNRQRARAIFVGDSGIDSVNSSTTSITHSLEFDGEGHKEGLAGFNNARIDILNPIHESDTEVSESIALEISRNSGSAMTADSNATQPIAKSGEGNPLGTPMTRFLSNQDLGESSLV